MNKNQKQTKTIMKKILLSFAVALIALFSANSFAQELKTGGAELSFEKEVHDYGTMEKGGDPECSFVFTNTGNEPLIITKAKGSCGCTVPEWPKAPIAPGAKAVITVKYDTQRVGPINKTVTITSNATNVENGVKVIRIKGKINAPADLAPVKEQVGPTAN